MIKIEMTITTVYRPETEERLRARVCSDLNGLVWDAADTVVINSGRTGPVSKQSLDVSISSQIVPGNKRAIKKDKTT